MCGPILHLTAVCPISPAKRAASVQDVEEGIVYMGAVKLPQPYLLGVRGLKISSLTCLVCAAWASKGAVWVWVGAAPLTGP
jgi:hypothetical protein